MTREITCVSPGEDEPRFLRAILRGCDKVRADHRPTGGR